MRKSIQLLLILMTIFLMVACETTPAEPTEVPGAFDDLVDTLEEALPPYINDDFILPTLDGYDLTWSMDGVVFDDVFIYESPFYDRLKTLKVRISDREIYSDHELSVFVHALESGLNNNKLYINTPVGHNDVSRETYISTSMTFLTERNGVEVVEHIDTDVELRGRGNSTWDMPKKSFRIRFREDTSIYDMPAARNYVLLAEYADKSFVRNAVVHKFSSLLDGIDHSIQTRFVEVWFNDDYLGLYVLSEQVESHENKLYVDVDYDRIDAGFLVELDQRMFNREEPEGLHWFNLFGRAYDIIRPNTENDRYTQAHTDYIESYFFELEEALLTQSGYESLIDLDNFIDYFIVQELVKNVDIGYSSVFKYKQQDDVLKMGPLWDYDLALGNADYIDYGPENFYGFASNKNVWFHLLMRIPEFRQHFAERFSDIYLDYIPEILTLIDVLGASLMPAAQRNYAKWQTLSIYVWPNPPEMLAATTYPLQVAYVREYLEARSLWLYVTLNSQDFQNGLYNE